MMPLYTPTLAMLEDLVRMFLSINCLIDVFVNTKELLCTGGERLELHSIGDGQIFSLHLHYHLHVWYFGDFSSRTFSLRS